MILPEEWKRIPNSTYSLSNHYRVKNNQGKVVESYTYGFRDSYTGEYIYVRKMVNSLFDITEKKRINRNNKNKYIIEDKEVSWNEYSEWLKNYSSFDNIYNYTIDEVNDIISNINTSVKLSVEMVSYDSLKLKWVYEGAAIETTGLLSISILRWHKKELSRKIQAWYLYPDEKKIYDKIIALHYGIKKKEEVDVEDDVAEVIYNRGNSIGGRAVKKDIFHSLSESNGNDEEEIENYKIDYNVFSYESVDDSTNKIVKQYIKYLNNKIIITSSQLNILVDQIKREHPELSYCGIVTSICEYYNNTYKSDDVNLWNLFKKLNKKIAEKIMDELNLYSNRKII